MWGLVHAVTSIGGLDDILFTSMKEAHLPASYLASEICMQWASIISKTAWDTLRSLCCHRYRLLSKLDIVISAWGKISNEGIIVDYNARKSIGLGDVEDRHQWFSKWSMIQVTRVMDLSMHLLAEMELLSSFETASFIWYVDYINSTRHFALGKTREFRTTVDREVYDASVADAQAVVAEHKKKKSANKGHTAGGRELKEAKRVLDAPPPTPLAMGCEEQLLRVNTQMLRGILRILLCASREGFIPRPPESEYTTMSLRFDQRYRSFRDVSGPPPTSLADFESTVETLEKAEPTVDALLTSATTCLENAKTMLTYLRKIVVQNLPPALSGDRYLITPFTYESDAAERCMSLLKV
jgi:hypothetical protein